MTSQEAHARISAAMETLKQVRDALAADLPAADRQPDLHDPEGHRKSILYQRAALAISACRRA